MFMKKVGHSQNETLARWPFSGEMADCLVYVSMSGQSVLAIRGQNFLSGIMATAETKLRAIEYICVLSTVLTDIYPNEGVL